MSTNNQQLRERRADALLQASIGNPTALRRLARMAGYDSPRLLFDDLRNDPERSQEIWRIVATVTRYGARDPNRWSDAFEEIDREYKSYLSQHSDIAREVFGPLNGDLELKLDEWYDIDRMNRAVQKEDQTDED